MIRYQCCCEVRMPRSPGCAALRLLSSSLLLATVWYSPNVAYTGSYRLKILLPSEAPKLHKIVEQPDEFLKLEFLSRIIEKRGENSALTMQLHAKKKKMKPDVRFNISSFTIYLLLKLSIFIIITVYRMTMAIMMVLSSSYLRRHSYL